MHIKYNWWTNNAAILAPVCDIVQHWWKGMGSTLVPIWRGIRSSFYCSILIHFPSSSLYIWMRALPLPSLSYILSITVKNSILPIHWGSIFTRNDIFSGQINNLLHSSWMRNIKKKKLRPPGFRQGVIVCMRMKGNRYRTEKKKLYICVHIVCARGIGARLAIVLHCGRTECFGERWV